MPSGTLYVVATPIGNLADLAPRAANVLRDVTVVAAEDTRRTARLLSHFGLQTPLLALHEHNEDDLAPRLVERLLAGENVALVSDAGTPLISDPGFRLVCGAHASGVPVSPVPGPSAVMAALSVAGLPSDRFTFEGFLPAKQVARQARLAELAGERRTMVFYVAVHRVKQTIADLGDTFGADRSAFVGRELTKLHEQCLRGTLGQLAEYVAAETIPARGEFVVAVAGTTQDDESTSAATTRKVLGELMQHLPGKTAVNIAATVTGARRNTLYKLMLELEKSQPD